MREVASFMQMYPAYQLRDVLEEHAVTFYALLAEGYRMRFKHYEMIAEISLLPNVHPDFMKKWFKQIEWASKHPADILSSSGESSSNAEIKKLLGG